MNTQVVTSEGVGEFNLIADVSTQRYRVEGQRATLIELSAGDLLTIESLDGQQHAELIVRDKAGNFDPSLLSSNNQQPTSGIAKQLSSPGAASQALAEQLSKWQLNPAELPIGIQVKACNQPATLTAMAPISVIVAAPGANMDVSGTESPATELLVRVTSQKSLEALPPPLADVKTEFRISRATAHAYPVKAGEWIQIIDVAGKQCSDFVAFDQAELAAGRECGLDITATRSVMGTSNPQPGLYSRYLDANMQSMVEIAQDSVGRHDSFLLACTEKYYDDSGYFGHVSCSENFNKALAPYGIRPRSGWPAINFFFNTYVEADGSMGMDEPWSVAGDYVLLRANRDLLCASSACPDDIDPANGWCPTDIHVRVYDSDNQFPRAIAHRISAEELPRMTKKTGFYDVVTALTQKLIEYRGYWVASEYEGWGAQAEYLACRERVAMIDLSPLRKFEVTGPDSEAFLQYVLTRDVRRLAIGEVTYSALCFDTGGMVDDGTLFRLSSHAFRWVCGDAYSATWMGKVAAEKGYRVSIRNSTDQLHNLAVQGPQSRNLLADLIWTSEHHPSVTNLKWFHFLIGKLGGPKGIPVLVSRTGYTGELGYEIWCHPDNAKVLWQTLWSEGQQYGIAPLGFDALDMLRIEAGLIFANHEFCAETNPIEAGIGFTVPMKSKKDDFIGRTAIANQAPQSRKKLMGLMISGNEPASHGDTVYQDRMPVGVVTSATNSPILSGQIALARLSAEYAVVGKKLSVGKLDGQRKRLPAEVVSLPFYDPERSRVRA